MTRVIFNHRFSALFLASVAIAFTAFAFSPPASAGNVPTAKTSKLAKQSCDELEAAWRKLVDDKPKLHRKINDKVDDVKSMQKKEDALNAEMAEAQAEVAAATDSSAKKAARAKVKAIQSDRRELGNKSKKLSREEIGLKRQMRKLRTEIEKYDTALRDKGCR